MKVKIKEAALKFKNWSLYRLAKELEISEQNIYTWANAKAQPSYENMDRICQILGCNIEDILEAQDVQTKLKL